MKIIKNLCSIIIPFILIFCSSANFSSKPRTTKNIKIGIENRENYIFLIDTLSFKNNISENIFSIESKMSYDKIEICKGATVGEAKEKDFYFLKMQNFEKNVVTVRYLVKEKKYYILSDESTFNSYYVTCVGKKENCPPNVYINENNEKVWICSNDVRYCSTDSVNCTIYRTILVD